MIEGTVPFDQIANESLNGFAPGSGARIEVTGSRTFALLLSATGLDAAALSAVLADSTDREAIDFARVLSASAVNGAPALVGDGLGNFTIDEATRRLFAEAELGTPTLREAGGAGVWVTIRLAASTYLPGSRVYLVATSSPVIFGTAIVGTDGTAVMEGGVPVSLLGDGEHRLRLIGTREIDGVTVKDDGSIELTDETMTEIGHFDDGTTATVRISGTAGSGVDTSLVRFVPLRTEIPWIWLLVPLAVALLGALLRRRLGDSIRPLVAVAVVLAGGGVAFAAYVSMFIPLAAAAIALGLALAALHLLVRRRASLSLA